MKFIKSIMLASTLLASSTAFGSMITNGDFASSCNLDDWDSFGDVSISGAPSNCAAELAINDIDFEAELSQGLTLTAGFDYLLSVDFDFTTSLPSIEDSFFISLINQDLDFYDLLPASSLAVGNNVNSFVISTEDLINNFANQNWSLSFYLYDEVFDDNSASSVAINQVSLTQVSADVPEPSSFALFALGVAGLMNRRKVSRAIICYSQAKE